MKNKTKSIVINAFIATLIFVSTKVINIPTVIGGVINFGDAIILFSATFLSTPNIILSAAIGSSLADFFSPFAIYTPATLIIKSLLAFISSSLYKKSKNHNLLPLLSYFLVAESIMVIGYFIFEAYILGFGSIVASYEIINNTIQAIASSLLAILLYKSLKQLTK